MKHTSEWYNGFTWGAAVAGIIGLIMIVGTIFMPPFDTDKNDKQYAENLINMLESSSEGSYLAGCEHGCILTVENLMPALNEGNYSYFYVHVPYEGCMELCKR